MELRELGRTGERVSVIGFGCGPLGQEYGALDENEGARAVRHAIECGVNLFDTAPYYGRTLSEERLGRALEGVRDRVLLATKCCRYDKDGFDFSAERVRASIDESLARLRTDHVDLFQIHDVEFGPFDLILNETLPALRAVQATGKARFVGITGLPIEMLRRLADAFDVDTVLSYCHGNLMTNDMGAVLGPLAEHGVGLINASPLHMGVLAPGGQQAWHPAPTEVLEMGRRVSARCTDAGIPVARFALRYALDRVPAASTLVGMRTAGEVDENLTALEGELDPALVRELEELVAPVRDWTWHEGLKENAPSRL
ncbi:MAG: hypothetical protein GY711_33365 [bacterium]|nr:hypothetical protein [bacterium]